MKWQPAGKPTPALLVRPAGAVSLDEAYLAIDQWEFYSRKKLDAAQRLAVELMMAEGADGRWAAKTTGRAEPRQNGKGDEIEVVEFYGLTQRGEAIVHTAHEIPTARSAHLRMCGLFGHSDFRGKFHPTFGNGNFEIEWMPDGRRNRENPVAIIVYRTRTGGSGRGLDDISRLVVDEAQHAQEEQLASASPILLANPNGQLNLIGTAAILGKSDWWWMFRKRALRGDDDGFAWLEHSAERVELDGEGRVASTAPDPEDRGSWAQANPAFGKRITEADLAEQLRRLPTTFPREHQGVWDPPPVDDEPGIIPYDAWLALALDGAPPQLSQVAYGLAVADDQSWAAIGSAGRLPDGDLYIDKCEYAAGTSWLVAKAVEYHKAKRLPFWVDPVGAEGAFIKSLRTAGVKVIEIPSRDYQQACGSVLTAVNDSTIHHLGQTALNIAVKAAGKRVVGREGAWVWEHPEMTDISPLKAATVALAGVGKARSGRAAFI